MRRLSLLLLLAAVVLGAVTAAHASHVSDSSLIARWPGDDLAPQGEPGGVTPDVSGHGLDLVGQGFLFAGRFDQALLMNGFERDGFQAAENALFEPPEGRGLSVSGWVFFNIDSEFPSMPDANEMILAKGGRNCRQPSYALTTGANGGLEFAVDMDNDATFLAGDVVRTPPIQPERIWDDDWHAVTATYGAPSENGARSVKLWIDGRQVAAEEVPEGATQINYSSRHVADRQLTVGRIIQDGCTENRSFGGWVDDLRVYSEALDRRQIRFLHERDASDPPDLDAEPPPGFADWTAVEEGTARGTLLGASISLVGSDVSPESVVDGFDDRFDDSRFTPRLRRSDSIELAGATGNAYTIELGAPVQDPLIHVSSLSSTLDFPAGTQITKVSGDDGFTVSGSSVSGTVNTGPFGDDSSGTIKLTGSFTQIPFTTTAAIEDPIFVQVGRPRPRPAATNVVRPQVSGTPSPGSTLSCTEGEWEGSDANLLYTYTWERAPRATRFEDDQAWGPIDGASGTTATQYTVQDVDLSSRVRCRVTRSDFGGVNDANSRSLRVDSGIPVNVTSPRVIGNPVGSFGAVTCDPGEWRNGPSFEYRWLRDGQPIAGPLAAKARYVPRFSRFPNSPDNPDGDGNHFLSCRVTASNDVGSAAPATSDRKLSVDDVPLNVRKPTVSLPNITPGGNSVGREASCQPGDWIDSYGQFGQEPYTFKYQWFRGSLADGAAISGATGQLYPITVADLGKNLYCTVVDSNPVGSSAPVASLNVGLVPLPFAQVDSRVYKAGGRNSADPTNLLAIGNEYARVVSGLVIERLQAAVDEEQRQCLEFGIPQSAPPPASVKAPITRDQRCRILLFARERVKILEQGVRYDNGNCFTDHSLGNIFKPNCPDLRFQAPAIDPKRAPPTDPELLRRLEPITPQVILWDLDRNGTTDATCPGSAPVLRTILPNGGWRPRAVIVTASGLNFGETQFRAPITDTTTMTPGRPRASQVKVCATAFDPPPDPEQGPCVTAGEIGRVRVEGNLCPIDLRQVEGNDFKNFDGDLKRLLIAQSTERLRGEGIEAAARRDGPKSTEPVWLDTGDPKARRSRLDVVARVSQAFGTGASAISATYANTAASLTSFGNGGQARAISATLKRKLDAIPSVNVRNAGFALDQIYLSRADTMRVNGVAIDPLGNSGALLVPSDVKGALTNVREMTVSARNAATSLGAKATGIPLSQGENLKAEVGDTVAGASRSLLKETNLDQLAQKLSDAAGKLSLGPFKLRGSAQVKLADDGTATLDAKAVLPGLELSPGGGEIRADVKLRGDREGRVKLQGIRVRAPYAYLGPVKLKDLDLTYENGIDVRGKILFPAPVSAGIGINRFKLGPGGEFQILDLDYLAGAGSGIPVGPGVFITKLGGALNLIDDTVKGRTTVSVGPAATDGGCPTLGIEASFDVHFAELFYLDARGDVKLVCLTLAQLKFHADASGLVTLDGIFDFSAGPIFLNAQIGAALRLPNWQVTASGSGGVRGIPLIGTISAQVKLALSNIGLAGCGKISLPLVPDPAGGAGIRFPGGRPPFTIVELIANIRFFVGCDISEYYSVVQRAVARGAQAGLSSFQIPEGTGPALLSIEGAGGAPRVRLRTPSGQVLDYTDATGEDGKTVGPGLGTVLETEDRTVVLLGRTEPGTWTAEVAEGSPAVVRVRRADILPKAKVRGRVTGRGAFRTLRYDVKPLRGQSVRLVEVAKDGRKVLRIVKRGGRGRVRFRVTEAGSRRRRIVAEVIQDRLPRTNLMIARFKAKNPRVGKPRDVRVRRRGKRAIVTWRRARLGSGIHEVTVRYRNGRSKLLTPKRGTRRLAIRRVGRREGLRVRVVAFSPAGHRGRPATGRLRPTARGRR